MQSAQTNKIKVRAIDDEVYEIMLQGKPKYAKDMTNNERNAARLLQKYEVKEIHDIAYQSTQKRVVSNLTFPWRC